MKIKVGEKSISVSSPHDRKDSYNYGDYLEEISESEMHVLLIENFDQPEPDDVHAKGFILPSGEAIVQILMWGYVELSDGSSSGFLFISSNGEWCRSLYTHRIDSIRIDLDADEPTAQIKLCSESLV